MNVYLTSGPVFRLRRSGHSLGILAPSTSSVAVVTSDIGSSPPGDGSEVGLSGRSGGGSDLVAISTKSPLLTALGAPRAPRASGGLMPPSDQVLTDAGVRDSNWWGSDSSSATLIARAATGVPAIERRLDRIDGPAESGSIELDDGPVDFDGNDDADEDDEPLVAPDIYWIRPSESAWVEPLRVAADGTLESAEVARVVTQPAHGLVTWIGGFRRFQYQPFPGFRGTDAFEYVIGAGGLDGEPGGLAEVVIHIFADKPPPTCPSNHESESADADVPDRQVAVCGVGSRSDAKPVGVLHGMPCRTDRPLATGSAWFET